MTNAVNSPESVLQAAAGPRQPRRLKPALAGFLVAAAMLAAACMPSGVASVSGNGEKFAVVNGNDLYVYSVGNQDIAYYTFFPDLRYSPALAPDGSAVAYVDRGGRLQYQPLDGVPPRQLLQQSINQPGPGVLTFLPDGKLLVLNAGNFDRELRVFDPATGQTVTWLQGLGQIFYSAGAILPRESSSALNREAVGRIDASRLDTVRLVIIPTTCITEERQCFFSYSIDAEGFKDHGPLPRRYDTDAQIFFSRRAADDITSGLLTPDGRWLVVRLQSFAATQAESLFLVDLSSDAAPIPLVENAPGRVDYALSPDGQFVIYEDAINNVEVVRLYNIATGERTDLGLGTFDPEWWQ